MSLPPPPRPHYQGEPSQYRPVQQHHVAAQRQDKAPTLGQYWRSDTRIVPGGKPAKWAGRAAFWLGLLAVVLYFAPRFFADAPTVFAAFASPVSVVAFIFALIAIIAGVGRGLGIFGLIFALAGSSLFWSWLDRTLA
ncbi:hypothetical protein [Pseudolysinimonas sp.]|uniref:hypothetical protein n=1 Tax=Pseudolysinimonas sp. TaxID=2680009 RepID=UPI00286D66BD|nr:hypothetical protein [Pseudolysinimonas sp.]